MTSDPQGGSRPKPPATSSAEDALQEMVHSRSPEILRAAAAHPALTEELALALLTRRDLPQRVLEDLGRNGQLMKHRKVVVALVAHPRTPRHVSMPIIRHLHTFELMQIALTPAIAPDVKVRVEESIMARLETLSSGERLTLAKRGSTRIAAALLEDAEGRIIEAALNNPYLTEVWITKAVLRDDAGRVLVSAVCRHPKWSLRQDVRIALVRCEQTPEHYAAKFAQSLPAAVLQDIVDHARLSERVRGRLEAELARREGAEPL